MKQYDSSELMDIHSLAECDLQWSVTCIEDLKNEVKRLQEEIKTNKHFCSIHFDRVIEKANMFHYLIEDRRNYYDVQKEAFEKEMGE